MESGHHHRQSEAAGGGDRAGEGGDQPGSHTSLPVPPSYYVTPNFGKTCPSSLPFLPASPTLSPFLILPVLLESALLSDEFHLCTGATAIIVRHLFPSYLSILPSIHPTVCPPLTRVVYASWPCMLTDVGGVATTVPIVLISGRIHISYLLRSFIYRNPCLGTTCRACVPRTEKIPQCSEQQQ